MWKLHIYITTKWPVYEVYLIKKKLVLLIKAIIKNFHNVLNNRTSLLHLLHYHPGSFPSWPWPPTLTILRFTLYRAYIIFFTMSKVSFLSSVPLHGMAFPFHFDRNPFWTPSDQTLRHSFSQKHGPAMFSFQCCCLHSSEVSVCCLFKFACKLNFV